MKLACILLNYCDCELTKQSAMRAAGYENIDNVIIVDNASPTGDYDSLLELQSEKIAVVRSEKNGGYGSGNNLGIKYAKEEIGASHVIIANPDVIFSEECVDDIVNVFSKYDECAAVAPATYYREELCASKLPNEWQIVLESFSVINKLFGRETRYKKSDYEGKTHIFVDVVVGAMIAFSLNKIEGIWYDEKLFLYSEELVMGYKLKERKLATVVSLNSSYKHGLSHTIDQTYNGLFKKRKLASKSKMIYLKDYLMIGKVRLLLFKMLLEMANVEAFLIDRIGMLLKGKSK